MKCPKCGKEVPEGTAICPECKFNIFEDTISVEEKPAATEKMAFDISRVRGERSLVITGGHDIGSEIELKEGNYIVGRDPEVDIFLNDITVSRRHAEINITSFKAMIRDLGSLNGTYVNGARIDDSEISSGDEIQIGKFKLLYVHKRGD